MAGRGEGQREEGEGEGGKRNLRSYIVLTFRGFLSSLLKVPISPSPFPFLLFIPFPRASPFRG